MALLDHMFSFLVFLLVLGSCLGLQGTNIVGGEDVAEGEFPYHVTIYLQMSLNGSLYNGTYCGGTLLEASGKQFVLTSATCVGVGDFPDPTRYRLEAGDVNKVAHSGNEQIRYPNRIIVHREWDYTSKINDIAIVSYEEPFIFNDFVKPLALPSQSQITTGDVIITGWGGLNDSYFEEPDILQKLRLPVISDEDCLQSYSAGSDFNPADSMICAQSSIGGHSFCNGDRGGPVVSVNGGYLAGIMVYLELCDREKGRPDVFTEISHYVDWIIKNANDL